MIAEFNHLLKKIHQIILDFDERRILSDKWAV